MKKHDKVFKSGQIADIDPVSYGIGEIVDIAGDKVTVLWENSGRQYTYDKKYVALITDHICWVNSIDSLPKSDDWAESCNPYYFIELENGISMLAMYMNNGWWQSYTCKVMVPVKRWIKTFNAKR